MIAMIVTHYNDIATLDSSNDGTTDLNGVYCIEVSLNYQLAIASLNVHTAK